MGGDRSVALVTCAEFANGYDDDWAVVAPLAARGVDVTFAVWDDAAVDWARFDLVVLRSTWDYTSQRDRFLTWVCSVPSLANPAAAVAWSSDKTYLRELAATGASVVPTTFVAPGPGADAGRAASAIAAVAATADRFVVKPSVGSGSVDAGRFDSADEASVEIATKHAGALLEQDRTVMVQPYLEQIDTAGESSLVFFEGRFSHAVRKEPLLSGGLTEPAGLFVDETISVISATAGQIATAAAILGATPFDVSSLLYARVDLLPGPDNTPTLLELEMVEPSLFLGEAEGAAERFAAAIDRTIANGRRSPS